MGTFVFALVVNWWELRVLNLWRSTFNSQWGLTFFAETCYLFFFFGWDTFDEHFSYN